MEMPVCDLLPKLSMNNFSLNRKKRILAQMMDRTFLNVVLLRFLKTVFRTGYIRAVNYHHTPDDCADNFEKQLQFYQNYFSPVSLKDLELFLNNKFIQNKTLLAENFYKQKKYDLSKKTYNSLKKIGSSHKEMGVDHSPGHHLSIDFSILQCSCKSKNNYLSLSMSKLKGDDWEIIDRLATAKITKEKIPLKY